MREVPPGWKTGYIPLRAKEPYEQPAPREDTGTLQSLTFLNNAGRVDVDRVLVLRTASNYSMQHGGITAQQSLVGEDKGKYSAYIPSLENAYLAGMRVVEEWLQNPPQE